MADFTPNAPIPLSSLVTRIVAANAGPMTGPGTNTYLVGRTDVTVIDPGPADASHLDAILAAAPNGVARILLTHFHADHIGGILMGHQVEGVATLLERCSCPVHVHADEVPWITRTSGLTASQLRTHDGGDVVKVGDIEITLVHTPGHTPGSQCFFVDGRLVSGDTLFLDGCGRTDFPGSDPAAMYDSLQTLASMPEGTVVFPGHRYSAPSSATIDAIKQQNYVYRPQNKQQWLTMFGHD